MDHKFVMEEFDWNQCQFEPVIKFSIDIGFLRLLLEPSPTQFQHIQVALCHVVCWTFLTYHLLILKAMSFFSIQIVQSMTSLRSNQIWHICLEKKEPSFQLSHDPNQEASKAPFRFALAFIFFTIPMEIPHDLPTKLQSQNLCGMVLRMSKAHVSFVIHIGYKSCMPRVKWHYLMPQGQNEHPFLLASYNILISHLRLRLGFKSPPHLSNISLKHMFLLL